MVDRYKIGLRKFENTIMDLKYDIEPKYMAVTFKVSLHFSSTVPPTILSASRIVSRSDLLSFSLKRGNPWRLLRAVLKASTALGSAVLSSAFRSFLRSHLSVNTNSTNSAQYRVLLLIVILIALVLLFLKTIRSSYGDSTKNDLEEQAPLVSRSPEQNAA